MQTSHIKYLLSIFLLLSFLSIKIYGQNEIENKILDSTQVKKYYDLAYDYYEASGKGDSLISYGKKIIDLSEKHNDLNNEIIGLGLIGSGYMINRDYMEAETYLIQGLGLAELNNNIKGLADIHNRLGGLYQNIDKLPDAIKHLIEASKFSKEVSDFKTEAMAYYGISVIYTTQNQKDKQIEYISKATKLCDVHIEIKPLARGVIYGSAAQQYSILGDEPQFKTYKDSSLTYAKKALKVSQENNLNQRIPSDLIVLSSHYINIGDQEKGKEYAEEALAYTSFMRDDTKLNLFITLAHIHRAENNKQLCYTYLDSLKNMKLKERPYYGSSIEKYRYTSYKYFKDFDLAFEALDSYFNFESKKKEIEQNKTINELETKYKTEIKDAQIKKLWTYLIIALSIILLGGLILKWMQLRKTRERNVALKDAIKQQLELEKELINVRDNIARDFHDDLGNKLARISFLSRLVEDELSDSENSIKSKVTQVKEDTVSLYVGTKDFIFSLKPNSDYLEEVVTYLSDFGEDYFSKTSIKFVLDKNISLNKKLPHYWSKHLIYIFKEAMTNAFKHSNCSQLILQFEHDRNALKIKCIDNGIGIPEDQRKSKNGLLNMKSRAEKIGGELQINSVARKGTTIVFIGETK